MKAESQVIEVKGLHRGYGRRDAVRGLDLQVRRGCCYGFFGRNGAGKTTTIKCLLNLLKPRSGSVRVFGLDPAKCEVEVRSRLSYVPDQVAFYPWMTVREVLDYQRSFRPKWNAALERELLGRFTLDPGQKAASMSKGQKTQLALIAAIAPEPELLVLDEPTSGLDPIVRREFIETVIGAYQSSDPERRTVFVSTHLISEFEGLIDAFTVVDSGRNLISMEADEARARFRKIHVRFGVDPGDLKLEGVLKQTRRGREVQLLTNGATDRVMAELRRMDPEEMRLESLSLEEIFVASDVLRGCGAGKEGV